MNEWPTIVKPFHPFWNMLNPALRDRLINLGFKYIELYKDGVFQLEMIQKFGLVRQSILSMYNRMVGYKEIGPVEQLDQDAKNRLWAECKPYTAGLSKEDCVEVVKCIYALNHLAAIKEKEANGSQG